MPVMHSCSRCGKYFSPESSNGQNCPNCHTKLFGLKQAKQTQKAGWYVFFSIIIGCAIGQMFSDTAAFFGALAGFILPTLMLYLKNK